MPTSNTEELGHFLKCTVIGRGVFGPCACCDPVFLTGLQNFNLALLNHLQYTFHIMYWALKSPWS